MPKFNNCSTAETLAQKFWANVVMGPKCWGWKGGIQKRSGSAIVSHLGAMLMAKHVAWKIAYGEYPVGAKIQATCKMSACVNPAHLKMTTRARLCNE